MADTTVSPKRRLGKTDLMVSPIGLGMMEFGGGGGLFALPFPVIAQENKNAAVRAALERGVNWFDTAEIYGDGVSEASLAKALKAAGKQDQDVIVATKWWPLFRTAGSIRRTIDNRLRFLGGYSIGLYMVHQPFGLSSKEAEMEAMADLVQAGKIRSIGVSNFNPEQMRRAQQTLQKRGLSLAVNQVPYSLVDRKIETNGVLDTARELGITIIAYTPLGFGLLTGKYHKDPGLLSRKSFYTRFRLQGRIENTRPLVAALEQIGARHNATPSQVALNWVIQSQGDIVVTIPGVTNMSQAEQNAEAMRFTLSPDELASLDELSRSFR